MAKILVLLCVFFSLKSYAQRYILVSDLDDTVKITNVSDFSEAVRNALFSTKAFQSMPKLFSIMGEYVEDIYILTASPSFLNSRVDHFLAKNKIQVREVFLRNLFRDKDKYTYKFSTLERIKDENPDAQMILLGDDVEIDAKVYKDFEQKYPENIAAIYIHTVKKNKLPVGIKSFYTAYDIALEEYLAKRMKYSDSFGVGKDVLISTKMDQSLPHFVYCPSKESDFKDYSLNGLSLITRQVERKILSYCRSIQ